MDTPYGLIAWLVNHSRAEPTPVSNRQGASADVGFPDSCKAARTIHEPWGCASIGDRMIL